MATFRYSGVNEAGKSVRGVVDAETARGARGKLRERGIFASDVREESRRGSAAAAEARAAAGSGEEAAAPSGAARFGLGRRQLHPKQLSRITRQLATLLHAGVPLTEALDSLRRQAETGPVAEALTSIHARVTEGANLADAVQEHPEIFATMYTGMIRAGEATGALELVLRRIADHADASARMRSQVRTALTYPAIMSVVGGGIVIFLLAYVVPQVTRVFLESSKELPLPTRILITAGDIVTAWGWLLAILGIGALLGLRAWANTEKGRRRLESTAMRLPWIGRLTREVNSAQLAQTLATLVSGGLPLVDALQATRAASASRLMSDTLGEAATAVTEGRSLADCLAAAPVLEPMVVDMIRVGERSGDLEGMLGRAAEALDEEVRSRVEVMAGLLEPVMILVMAGIVLFVVLAILLPVFEMNQLIQ